MDNLGGALPGYSRFNLPIWGTFKDATHIFKSNQFKNDINAHEFSHWVQHHIPKLDKSIYEPIIQKSVNEDVFNYLNNVDEWLARGTQIKNYFGLKEGEELTGDMLRYAAKNMVKDRSYDNNLSYFFAGIKDFDKIAKFLNKYALDISVPIIMLNDKNEQNKEIKY